MLTKHFKLDEFKCPCCGEVQFATGLIKRLELARKVAGVPFKINSAYRCQKHNKEVGGKDTSSHLKGAAVDISCTQSGERDSILFALYDSGFTRIGIAKSFIHCDVDPEKSQNVTWMY